jgi:hypothetical protein
MPDSNGGLGAAAKPDDGLKSGRPPGNPAPSMAGGSGVVLWAYTLTTFLSALLLFSIQPLFAKMVLPVLGRLAVGVGDGRVLLPGSAAGRATATHIC